MLADFTSHKVYSSCSVPFIFNEELWWDKNSDVCIFACDFEREHYQPCFYDQLDIELPLDLTRAVPKRQAEFLAGRYAARQAMRSSNIDESTPKAVHIGPQRSPIWPSKFIGSITHNNNKAICAVTAAQSEALLGIDFESYIPSPLAQNLQRDIHTESEGQLLVEQDIPKNIATTIIFSAKESLFKALYPRVREYFGFSYARVSQCNLKANNVILTLLSGFANTHSIPHQYICYFELRPDGVFTFIHDRVS